MAWKARLFMGLMLTVMLLAIAGPVMADDDNNRQERREDRREFREDNFFINHHDGFHNCCNDFELDEDEIFDLDFGFVPLHSFAADDLEYCFWEYEGEGEWEYECGDLD